MTLKKSMFIVLALVMSSTKALSESSLTEINAYKKNTDTTELSLLNPRESSAETLDIVTHMPLATDTLETPTITLSDSASSDVTPSTTTDLSYDENTKTLRGPDNESVNNLRVYYNLHTKELYVEKDTVMAGNLKVNGTLTGDGVMHGPSVSTPNAIARFANNAGLELKDSIVLIDDAGNIRNSADIELNSITKNGNTALWPATTGAPNTYLGSDGSGNLSFSVPSGAGNVSADNNFLFDKRLVKTDTAIGPKYIQESGITIDDANNISGIIALNATTINAPTLNGNATSADTAIDFSGSLAGQVTGPQTNTVVLSVGGKTATAIANSVNATGAATQPATSANTGGALVLRDLGTGNFSAGTITASLNGNATSATTAGSFSGLLAGDVVGPQSLTVVNKVGTALAAVVASGSTDAYNATASSALNTIVKRDNTSHFSADRITLATGSIVNGTDATTKDYVDMVALNGIKPKQSAVAVNSVGNTSIAGGLQPIDGITPPATSRVLLTKQTDPVQNGLWIVNNPGAWSRPSDFLGGTTAEAAYVAITSGASQAGSSWICSTPAATIDTDPVYFTLFAVPGQTTGANTLPGAGGIFKNKTGATLNFKTLTPGNFVTITNPDANQITLALTATSDAVANTLVARNAFNSFSGNLTGNASDNVLKAGDTMTGNLIMARTTGPTTRHQINWQDDSGSKFVGLRAPSTVGTSYTINLPANAPSAGQSLQAVSGGTDTILTWATSGGSPSTTQNIYVALNGSDSNDGSLTSPYLTIAKALTTAIALATPVTINVGPGTYQENNSGGPLLIPAASLISIVGSSIASTTITPQDPGIDLFSIATPLVEFTNLTLDSASLISAGHALTFNSNLAGSALFKNIAIKNFSIGIGAQSTTNNPTVVLQEVQFAGNTIAVVINNIKTIVQDSIFQGATLITDPAANVGLQIAGSSANVTLLSSFFTTCATAVSVNANAHVRAVGGTIEKTINGFTCTSGDTNILSFNFMLNTPTSINVSAAGASTTVSLDGCLFDGADTSAVSRGIALQASTGASLFAHASSVENVVVGLKCSSSGTKVHASGLHIFNALTSIEQHDSSTLNFAGGTFDQTVVAIDDSTNVNFAAYNSDDTTTHLALGKTKDITKSTLYEILNGQTNLPYLAYEPNYYGSKGTIYVNENNNPTFNGIQSKFNDADYYVVTGDKNKEASINLISDATPGTSTTVRGWSMTKTGTTAELSFTFANNDLDQPARSAYTVMQLNGFDNQIEFPLAIGTNPSLTNTTAKLVWAGESATTNLYRSQANTLKTDATVVIGSLTPTAGIVHNDENGLLSSSLIFSDDIDDSAEIADSKLATITTPGKVANSATTATASSVADTLVMRDGLRNFSANIITANLNGIANGNLPIGGGTLSGALTLPAGTAATPSLRFTGGTTTGISMPVANKLSFDTNGNERMSIAPGGTITAAAGFVFANVLATPAVQKVTEATTSVTVLPTTAVLIKNFNTTQTLNLTFPPKPLLDGQLLTIIAVNTGISGGDVVNLNYTGANPLPYNNPNAQQRITYLNPSSGYSYAFGGGASVTYMYSAADDCWYRYWRG